MAFKHSIKSVSFPSLIILFVVIYFMTPNQLVLINGENIFANSNRIRETQLLGLRKFYNATKGYDSPIIKDWFTNPMDDYCEFVGVSCDPSGRHVVSLSLEGAGLGGSLIAIPELVMLRKIKINVNNIGGTIPNGFSTAFPELIHFEVAKNNITGTIPSEFSNLTALRRLIFQRNSLTGIMPSSLCNLSSHLMTLDVSFNSLHSTIPSCFNDMKVMRRFRLTNAGLQGSIPPALCEVREMNSLEPNTFGCDGVACGAGTHVSPYGRQILTEYPCLPCKEKTDLIGMVHCAKPVTVPINTQVPSSVPSRNKVPSSSPSLKVTTQNPLTSFWSSTAPSYITSNIPSRQSQHVTHSPSQIATRNEAPSTSPSLKVSTQNPSTLYWSSTVPSSYVSSNIPTHRSHNLSSSFIPSGSPSSELSLSPNTQKSPSPWTLHPTSTSNPSSRSFSPSMQPSNEYNLLTSKPSWYISSSTPSYILEKPWFAPTQIPSSMTSIKSHAPSVAPSLPFIPTVVTISLPLESFDSLLSNITDFEYETATFLSKSSLIANSSIVIIINDVKVLHQELINMSLRRIPEILTISSGSNRRIQEETMGFLLLEMSVGGFCRPKSIEADVSCAETYANKILLAFQDNDEYNSFLEKIKIRIKYPGGSRNEVGENLEKTRSNDIKTYDDSVSKKGFNHKYYYIFLGVATFIFIVSLYSFIKNRTQSSAMAMHRLESFSSHEKDLASECQEELVLKNKTRSPHTYNPHLVEKCASPISESEWVNRDYKPCFSAFDLELVSRLKDGNENLRRDVHRCLSATCFQCNNIPIEKSSPICFMPVEVSEVNNFQTMIIKISPQSLSSHIFIFVNSILLTGKFHRNI